MWHSRTLPVCSRQQRGGGGRISGVSTELLKLTNIGPAMARDFARLGITEPGQPAGRDPVELCALDGRRHDPCVLDTFTSAVDQDS